MLPLIIVTKNSKITSRFIGDYIKKNSILKNHIFEILPLKSEITINQIRLIKKELGMQMKDRRLFVIHSYDSASIEAQNAFLKVLEEKTVDNNILMIVENEYALLPTIRSRAKTIYLDEKQIRQSPSSGDITSLVNQLKTSEKPDFLVSNLITGITKEKALSLQNELILFFRNNLLNEPMVAVQSLKKILYYKSLLVGNNINPQMSIDSLLIFIWKLFRMKS